eukprot:1946191-Rhodomonas_salina.1
MRFLVFDFGVQACTCSSCPFATPPPTPHAPSSVHGFIVPLRDASSHALLPGVTCSSPLPPSPSPSCLLYTSDAADDM